MNRSIIALSVAIVLAACSTKRAQQEETQTSNDTVTSLLSDTASHSTTTAASSKHAKVNILLNDLLHYNSEAELKKDFGNAVMRSVGYYPEGMGEYQNTLLFGGTKNEVEFVWQDDTVSFSDLSFIRIRGQESDWKTKEGVALGTTLKELERLNQKSFIFSGFGWDYSGGVNWNEGQLEKTPVRVSLEYPDDQMPPEFEGLLGDQQIESSAVIAQKANPIVIELTMSRPDVP